MANQRIWWQRPRKYHDQEEERKVSFLELFFDLVFVVIISQLSHFLAANISSEGVLQFILLFIMIWVAWFNGSAYHDLHGNNDIRTRVFTFLQMFAVAAMAIFLGEAFEEYGHFFAAAYSSILLIQLFLWRSVAIHDPSHRPISKPYTNGYFIAVLIMIISIFMEDEIRTICWVIAVIILLIIPIIARNKIPKSPDGEDLSNKFYISPSLVERFGLITIIVLGEVIASAINGIAHHHEITFTLVITGVLMMLVSIGIWWLYFDFLSLKSPKKNTMAQNLWLYLHLPLTMAVTSLGATTLDIVSLHEEMNDELKHLILIAVITVYVIIAILLKVVVHEGGIKKVYQTGVWVTIIAALSTTSLFFVTLEVLYFLLLLTMIMIFPIYQSIKVWIREVNNQN